LVHPLKVTEGFKKNTGKYKAGGYLAVTQTKKYIHQFKIEKSGHNNQTIGLNHRLISYRTGTPVTSFSVIFAFIDENKRLL
jgi:hypothetical protein